MDPKAGVRQKIEYFESVENTKKRKRKGTVSGETLELVEKAKRRKTQEVTPTAHIVSLAETDVAEERFFIAQEIRTTERTFLKHLLLMKSVCFAIGVLTF